MNLLNKKVAIIVSSVLFIASLIINPYILNLRTRDGSYYIFDSIAGSIGKPLFFFATALVFASIMAYFARERAYTVWRTLYFYALPISLLLIFMTPRYGGGGLVEINRDIISILISVIVVCVTAGVVLLKK